jgi:hypothetical protein
MSSPVIPDIQVEITLFPTEQGGRHTAILSGEYRGVLGVGAEHLSVRFFVPAGMRFGLGSTVQVGVEFLFPEYALRHFPPGTEFTVWEGRAIGRGRVLEVLQPAQAQP